MGKLGSRYSKKIVVAIDKNLRFDEHVSNNSLKAKRKIRALTRAANYLLKKTYSCKIIYRITI